MKENIKSGVLILFTIYSILSIVLIFFTYLGMEDTIELNDKDSNINEIKTIKSEITNIKNEKCKSALNDMVNYYERTSYKGKVFVKEIYNDSSKSSYLNYYNTLKNNCNLDEEFLNDNNFNVKTLSASIQPYETVYDYIYNYEIKFTDAFSTTMSKPEFNFYRYEINRSNQIEVLKTVINHLKEVQND